MRTVRRLLTYSPWLRSPHSLDGEKKCDNRLHFAYISVVCVDVVKTRKVANFRSSAARVERPSLRSLKSVNLTCLQLRAKIWLPTSQDDPASKSSPLSLEMLSFLIEFALLLCAIPWSDVDFPVKIFLAFDATNPVDLCARGDTEKSGEPMAFGAKVWISVEAWVGGLGWSIP